MSRRIVTALPTLVAALVAAWYGYDFGVLRADVAIGASFWIAAVGFLLQAVVERGNLTAASAVSAATPGLTHGLLGLWMLLTAISEWHAPLDPHRRRTP